MKSTWVEVYAGSLISPAEVKIKTQTSGYWTAEQIENWKWTDEGGDFEGLYTERTPFKG